MKTWLFRIAVNEALRVQKHRKNNVVALTDNLHYSKMEGDAEAKLTVQTAMRKLPADQRAILALLYWEELSYEEISGVLNISLSAVKMRVKRAREAFHRLYGEDV